MKKQIISEEFRRMQKLAGIVIESQLNEIEGQQVADFLNQHKEEVFEKMFGYLKNEEGPDWGDKQYSDISINDMGEWEKFVDEEDGYTCARTDLYNYSIEAQARMTPFPDIDTLPEYLGETKIAGKTIYYFTFNY
jgi:hypothetical protein